VGYEEGGQLTEKVRRRPYSVILFDEIEKAHSDVFNVLLQILEDGRLTDGQGRVVNFKNTVIIMTSNIGSQYFQDTSATKSDVQKKVIEAVKRNFRPELVNRIDEIIVFNKLDKKDIEKIVDLQLADLRKKLQARNITLKMTPGGMLKLAEEGFDPEFGARPLRRMIQREIQDVLALKLLKGECKDGDTITIEMDKKTGEFNFSFSAGASK
jgi:ATP-dependent Clp protease ATP-binding subunit ClpB